MQSLFTSPRTETPPLHALSGWFLVCLAPGKRRSRSPHGCKTSENLQIVCKNAWSTQISLRLASRVARVNVHSPMGRAGPHPTFEMRIATLSCWATWANNWIFEIGSVACGLLSHSLMAAATPKVLFSSISSMLFHFAMEKQIHFRKGVLFHCKKILTRTWPRLWGPRRIWMKLMLSQCRQNQHNTETQNESLYRVTAGNCKIVCPHTQVPQRVLASNIPRSQPAQGPTGEHLQLYSSIALACSGSSATEGAVASSDGTLSSELA